MEKNKNIEKTGHPRPKSETTQEIHDGIEDYRLEQKTRVLDAITDKVRIVDGNQKKLTGRRPEEYAKESGVPLEELFPKNGKVLNIGDPWQTLDLPQVTSIDYESGEEAEFIYDTEKFLSNLEDNFQSTIRQANALEQTDLESALTDIQENLKTASVLDYDQIGNNILKLADQLSKRPDEKIKFGSDFMAKELWYKLHHIGQGLKDVHLMKTIIEPTVKEEKLHALKSGRHLSKDEEEKLIQRLVSDHRFIRRTKQAEIIKGTFPKVEFPDHSFDRITASWSISTHMFPEMNKNEFALYWDEIDRLLKKDGICYMWPIFRDQNYELADSLMDYFKNNGDACAIITDEHDQQSIVWVDEPGFANYLDTALALVVFPKYAPRSNKNRLINIIEKNSATDLGELAA